MYFDGMVGIAFTGGGTGGHIYPGLAVALSLQKLFSCRIFWIGSNRGMDRSIVEEAGLEFFGIPSGKLRRYFSFRNLSDVIRVGAGFFAARRILKKERPALLFSKGGFVSVPPCAAAASLNIPVFTHESDFSPGLATRINARFAERIFTAYEDTAAFFPEALRSRIERTGNPVRPAFRSANPAKGRAFLGLGGDERILLILGGSQGAREINGMIRAVLPELTGPYVVVHQTGPNADSAPAGPRYLPYPYIRDELPHVIAAAELVLGRSGAGTLWECAVLGKPLILIPLTGSGTRGDQVENARFFEKAGAAVTLLNPSPRDMLRVALDLAGDAKRRKAMVAACAAIGAGDGAKAAAWAIINHVKERTEVRG
jgi:UDP-N-acetylglucosamine--N-acetylmuramyl-(pentapeptide) pyrophosphoryl-undecaprenol N-acetylglucosamine transferase